MGSYVRITTSLSPSVKEQKDGRLSGLDAFSTAHLLNSGQEYRFGTYPGAGESW
jgi:hypothetical protein